MTDIESKTAIISTELELLISTISAIDGVRSIYLFGSYAYGEPQDGSDIDLMVIVDDTIKPEKIMLNINRALAFEKCVQVDILVNCISSFEERSAPDRVTLQREIKHKGVLVYDKC